MNSGAQIERVRISDSIIQARPTEEVRAMEGTEYRQFIQPFPEPLFTWFDGDGWRVEQVEKIAKRLIGHPHYKNVLEAGNFTPSSAAAIQELAEVSFRIGRNKVGQVESARLLTRFFEFLTDHSLTIDGTS